MTQNLLFLTATVGNPVTLPAGFKWASINPGSSGSYTITNSLDGALTNISTKTSGTLTSVMNTGESDDPDGWDQHIITAVSGTISIVYVSGI